MNFAGTSGTINLREAAKDKQNLGGRTEDLRARHTAGISKIGGRLQRIRNASNSAVQQKGSAQFGGGPRGFSRQLTQASRRGKARQGINSRGENSIRNQQLKDRLTLARSGINRRGVTMQASEKAAQLAVNQTDGLQRAKDTVDFARSSMFGSIAGGLSSAFKGAFKTGEGTLGGGVMDQQNELNALPSRTDFGIDPNKTGFGFSTMFDATTQAVG